MGLMELKVCLVGKEVLMGSSCFANCQSPSHTPGLKGGAWNRVEEEGIFMPILHGFARKLVQDGIAQWF